MTSKKEPPLHSLIAGTTAGAIEAYVVGFVGDVLELNLSSKFRDLSD